MFNSRSAASFSFDLAFMSLQYKSFETLWQREKLLITKINDVDIGSLGQVYQRGWSMQTMLNAETTWPWLLPQKQSRERNNSILKAKKLKHLCQKLLEASCQTDRKLQNNTFFFSGGNTDAFRALIFQASS